MKTVLELLLGGDWACAHGDAEGLGDVARQLEAVAPRRLRADLIAIRDAANTPGGNPFAKWASLRPALVEHLRDDSEPDPVVQRC